MKTKWLDELSQKVSVILILACGVILFPFILAFGVIWEILNFIHRKVFK